jgi:hypothetical protein
MNTSCPKNGSNIPSKTKKKHTSQDKRCHGFGKHNGGLADHHSQVATLQVAYPSNTTPWNGRSTSQPSWRADTGGEYTRRMPAGRPAVSRMRVAVDVVGVGSRPSLCPLTYSDDPVAAVENFRCMVLVWWVGGSCRGAAGGPPLVGVVEYTEAAAVVGSVSEMNERSNQRR